MKYSAKRPVLLLEVLIALALVVLCIFPLMAPHASILKAQYQFNHRVAMDQAVNRVYARILEKVYRNEIPWKAFEEKRVFPFEEDLLNGLEGGSGLGYQGSYQFSILRTKGGKEHPLTANVIGVTLTFEPLDATSNLIKKKSHNAQTSYEYQFFATQIVETHETTNKE